MKKLKVFISFSGFNATSRPTSYKPRYNTIYTKLILKKMINIVKIKKKNIEPSGIIVLIHNEISLRHQYTL